MWDLTSGLFKQTKASWTTFLSSVFLKCFNSDRREETKLPDCGERVVLLDKSAASRKSPNLL